jgi:hypothetical protein
MRARHLSMAGMGSNMTMPSEVGIKAVCWNANTPRRYAG